MEEINKIINIRHRTYTLTDKELLKLAGSNKFKYKFVSAISYNKKTIDKNDLTEPFLETFNDNMPFSLYELGTPIAILKSYMKGRINKEDLISAKKAFKELKYFASQCYERIIADLCCKVIMKELNTRNDEHLVFFIEKSASDKMLGRLASVYLNLDKITICFLIYDPSDLMTTIMSNQTGKLSFDIHRLMTTDSYDFSDPYPGDSEDSLIQTYFYKPPALREGGEFRPMRIDIFAQGLIRDKIEHKKELIKDILSPGSLNSESDHKSNEISPRMLMPFGFQELEEKLEKNKDDIIQRLLEIEE